MNTNASRINNFQLEMVTSVVSVFERQQVEQLIEETLEMINRVSAPFQEDLIKYQNILAQMDELNISSRNEELVEELPKC